MRDKDSGSFELVGLFTHYGVEAFLEFTNSLVAIVDREGRILCHNPSFEPLKLNLPRATSIPDFLSAPSRALFDEFLKNALAERTRKQANLEIAGETRGWDFSSLIIPLPDARVLFIAEPVFAVHDLESITAELESIKRALAIKETELRAVIAQADEVSHTDPLTFLPNRKRILADLQREVIFSDRYGTPLAISLIDIDHFKPVNDNYGHLVGDKVLRTLAMELREHIRHPDTLGRYGGEEFLVVLPHSTVSAAAEQAERLLKHVRSLVIPSDEEKISVTISIGLAQYKVHQEDWQQFLSRADVALYQAKNKGRNCWVVFEE